MDPEMRTYLDGRFDKVDSDIEKVHTAFHAHVNDHARGAFKNGGSPTTSTPGFSLQLSNRGWTVLLSVLVGSGGSAGLWWVTTLLG